MIRRNFWPEMIPGTGMWAQQATEAEFSPAYVERVMSSQPSFFNANMRCEVANHKLLVGVMTGALYMHDYGRVSFTLTETEFRKGGGAYIDSVVADTLNAMCDWIEATMEMTPEQRTIAIDMGLSREEIEEAADNIGKLRQE